MNRMLRLPLALLAVLPTAALAQHFAVAYIDVRLVGADSVRVSVEADLQDMMNTVHVFPYYADPAESAYRDYEKKIEYYLRQKVKVHADGKTVYLSAVAWKRGGKNRADGLDSVSIQDGNHSFTLGGKLPPEAKLLSVRSDIWNERDELSSPPAMDYYFFAGDKLLRRVWSAGGKWIRFPVAADSLAALRALPSPRMPPRMPMDHSKHND
jgi:hypothetical protein